MFVVYSGDDEVIVTTSEKENETVDLWFIKGGRDLAEYDRETFGDEAVSFSSRISRN